MMFDAEKFEQDFAHEMLKAKESDPRYEGLELVVSEDGCHLEDGKGICPMIRFEDLYEAGEEAEVEDIPLGDIAKEVLEGLFSMLNSPDRPTFCPFEEKEDNKEEYEFFVSLLTHFLKDIFGDKGFVKYMTAEEDDEEYDRDELDQFVLVPPEWSSFLMRADSLPAVAVAPYFHDYLQRTSGSEGEAEFAVAQGLAESIAQDAREISADIMKHEIAPEGNDPSLN